MTTPQRLLLWAVLGAILGTALDALHVVTGVLAYPNTPLGLQDWWVPLLFAASGIALGEGHRHVATKLAGASTLPRASTGEVLRGLGAFVVSYAASGFLKSAPWVSLLSSVAMFAACVAMTHPQARRTLLFHSAGSGITGPIVEHTLSSLGLFHYQPASEPLILGVPLWLPGIYLCVAVATAAVDRFIPSARSAS